MNWKTSRAVMLGGMLAGLVITLAERQIGWLGIAGLAVMVGSILQTLLFYRCPHCGRPFNIRGGSRSYCPYCGKKLD